eukprot:g6351.t3
MAGAIIAGVYDGLLGGLGWLVRRGISFCFSLMFAVTNVPSEMWSSFSNHCDGDGFYADPLGKPSVLTHWRGVMERTYASLSLAPKRTTEQGLAAAASAGASAADSPEWDGDGVKVADKDQPLVGVIIFLGALILPSAYAPLARTMARRGHPSYLLRFGFNLGYDQREQDGETGSCVVTERSTPPTKWVLVGHSMGIRGIELFYQENSSRVHGVVYMGAGNVIGNALAGANVPAMVLRGFRDPYVPAEALARSAHKLPKDFETVVVEGGNHRGFVSYTRQPLDWEATISEQEQRRLVVEALVDFIGRKMR